MQMLIKYKKLHTEGIKLEYWQQIQSYTSTKSKSKLGIHIN